jgi:hypothetical protein
VVPAHVGASPHSFVYDFGFGSWGCGPRASEIEGCPLWHQARPNIRVVMHGDESILQYIVFQVPPHRNLCSKTKYHVAMHDDVDKLSKQCIATSYLIALHWVLFGGQLKTLS